MNQKPKQKLINKFNFTKFAIQIIWMYRKERRTDVTAGNKFICIICRLSNALDTLFVESVFIKVQRFQRFLMVQDAVPLDSEGSQR